MSDKIVLVTPPDDILLDGIRIAHVQLTEEQSSIVSTALLNSTVPHIIINYIWKMGNSVEWLLDKIAKADIILFNAENSNIDPGLDVILGWTAAQPQSYYFGKLKDLHLANDRVIYNSEDISNLLEKIK